MCPLQINGQFIFVQQGQWSSHKTNIRQLSWKHDSNSWSSSFSWSQAGSCDIYPFMKHLQYDTTLMCMAVTGLSSWIGGVLYWLSKKVDLDRLLMKCSPACWSCCWSKITNLSFCSLSGTWQHHRCGSESPALKRSQKHYTRYFSRNTNIRTVTKTNLPPINTSYSIWIHESICEHKIFLEAFTFS